MSTFTDVYYATLPNVLGRRGVYPPARAEYIANTSNPLLRRQRYYVWLLLEHALEESLHKTLAEIQPYLTERGVWASPVCHFSLSHGDNAVAVAISDGAVGVDIQKRIERVELAMHILAPSEQDAFQTAEDPHAFLTELWTKKESLFKASGALRFQPKTLTADCAFTQTRWVDCADERYALSVTSPVRRLQEIQL